MAYPRYLPGQDPNTIGYDSYAGDPNARSHPRPFRVCFTDAYGKTYTDWRFMARSRAEAERQAKVSYGGFGSDLDFALEMMVDDVEARSRNARETLFQLARKQYDLAYGVRDPDPRMSVLGALHTAEARVYTLVAYGVDLVDALVASDVIFREFRSEAHVLMNRYDALLYPAKGKGSRPKKGQRFAESINGEIPADAFERQADDIRRNMERVT